MTASNRRQFFLQLGDSMIERLGDFRLNSIFPTPNSNNWHFVTRLSSMTPGSHQRLIINGEDYFVQSDDQGIWIENTKGERFALESRSGGTIFVNIQQQWPKQKILSQITGEAIEI